MTEETAFLTAIAENPADNLTRLVYADWLEEHGRPEVQWLRRLCGVEGEPHLACKEKVTALSVEQASVLPVFRDYWLSAGLRTGPADRVLARKGVCLAYAAAELPPPEVFVWLDSPLAGVIGARMLSIAGRAQVGDQVWHACYGQHDAGWLSFYSVMGGGVWSHVRAALERTATGGEVSGLVVAIRQGGHYYGTPRTRKT